MPDGDNSSPSTGLCVNDMILAINGTLIGGMTIVGFELELETSGSRLLLAVSRYKHAKDVAQTFAVRERQMLSVMDNAAKDNRLLGWVEIGNAPPPTTQLPTTQPQHSSKENQPPSSPINASVPEWTTTNNTCSNSSPAPKGKELNDDEDDDNSFDKPKDGKEEGLENIIHSKSSVQHIKFVHERSYNNQKGDVSFESDDEDNSTACRPKTMQTSQTSADCDKDDDSSKDWHDDENAWLGCVCGKVHKTESRGRQGGVMFWIQCDVCRSWYDVSSKCVGFTQIEAEAVDHWNCWACLPPSVQNEESQVNDIDAEDNPILDSDTIEESERVVSSPSKMQSQLGSRENRLDAAAAGSVCCPSRSREGTDTATRFEAYNDAHKSRQANHNCEMEQRDCESPKMDKNRSPRLHTQESKKSLSVKPVRKPPASTIMDSQYGEHGSQIRRNEDRSKHHLFSEKKSAQGSESSSKTESKPWLQRRMTNDGCVLPKSRPKRLDDGSFAKPPGPSPAMMDWDSRRGLWCTRSQLEKQQNQSKNQDSAITTQNIGAQLDKGRHDTRSRRFKSTSDSSRTSDTSKASLKGEIYRKGELVFVQPHSWPGKNCQGGIGKVVDFYKDDDGDAFYNVKLVVGGLEKGVGTAYISRHDFW